MYGHLLDLFADNHLVDIHLSPISPTRRNGRMGEERVGKRLDLFLVHEDVMELGLYEILGRQDIYMSPSPDSATMEKGGSPSGHPF